MEPQDKTFFLHSGENITSQTALKLDKHFMACGD